MDIEKNIPLLGNLSPRRFMQRHWQKKPLLVRQAVPVEEGASPWPLSRNELFALAALEEVESRLLVRRNDKWRMRNGPLPRTALPPISQPGWTLLVQGVDLHRAAAHELLDLFRFVPDARLDDVMVSYASDQGGVGPHFDSYDVFLLQTHGRRRWRIGRVVDRSLQPDVPLKLLQHFEPEAEYLLEPGDMLYLPPDWAHDGVAEGECMTCSIGFRAPSRDGLAREVMQRSLDAAEAAEGDPIYRDPRQDATAEPGRIPEALQRFTVDAVARLLRDPDELHCALGEVMSEPKPNVQFDGGVPPMQGEGVALDLRTRMVYDTRRIYINGESFLAGGRDARLMRALCDRRALEPADVARLSPAARELLDDWGQAGWLHATTGG